MTEPGYVIELPEGSLAVHDLTVGEAEATAPVVLAVHGITANGLSWRVVADEVARRHGPGRVRVLAPDLRGRGASRSAPGPYGLAAHADDVARIASTFGARPVLVGHSMGAFVVALAAARHPERFAGVVLVDGGLAFPAPEGLDIDAALQAVIGPAMDLLRMRFEDEDAYLAFWASHPAIGPALAGPAGAAVADYLAHDLVPVGDGGTDLRSTCVLEAVRADGADVLADAETHAAARACVEAGLPVELVWAERGLLDEPQGLYDGGRLTALDLPDEVGVTGVDANHYTVVLEAAGVRAVADAVDGMLADD